MILSFILVLTPPGLEAFKNNSCVQAAERETKAKGQSKDSKAYANRQMMKSIAFIEAREKKPGYTAKQILLDLYQENKKSCPEMTQQVPGCSLKDCEKLSEAFVEQTKAMNDATATNMLRVTKAMYLKQTSAARGENPMADTSIRDVVTDPIVREVTGKPLPKKVFDQAGQVEKMKNIEMLSPIKK